MNLELIFWAAAKTGNSTLFDIAVAHAKKTGELWLRPDNSTVHLCVFDPKSGKLAKPCTGTPQGLTMIFLHFSLIHLIFCFYLMVYALFDPKDLVVSIGHALYLVPKVYP